MAYTFNLIDMNGNPYTFEGSVADFEAHQQSAEAVRQRTLAYEVNEQLNLLADDVAAGLFGDAAMTGKFMSYIRDIKFRFPKPDKSA